jgi:hypothetical protein
MAVLLEHAKEGLHGRFLGAHRGGAHRPSSWSARRSGSMAILLERVEERLERYGGADGLAAGTGFSEKGDEISTAIHRLEKMGSHGSAVFGGPVDPSFLKNIPSWWIDLSTQSITKH